MNTVASIVNRSASNIATPRSSVSANSARSSASSEDTQRQLNALAALDDDELDNEFSQQSDEQLKALAEDMDPWLTVNGGVSAGGRIDFFNRLAVALSPENRTRWHQLLSEGLGKEFAISVSRFADPFAGPDVDNLEAGDSSAASEQWSKNEILQLDSSSSFYAGFVGTTLDNRLQGQSTDTSEATSATGYQASTPPTPFIPNVPPDVRVQVDDSHELLNSLTPNYDFNMGLIKGLPNITDDVNKLHRLASAMTNVHADTLRVEAGTLGWKELADTIVMANWIFREETGSNLIGSGKKGAIVLTYHTRYPEAMGITRSSYTYNDRKYGESGWQRRHSLRETYSAAVLHHADKLNSALWSRSGATDLEFVNTSGSEIDSDYGLYRPPAADNIGSDSPLDFSTVPDKGEQSNADYLIQAQRDIAALERLAHNNEYQQERLAYANFTLAGKILGVAVNGIAYAMYEGHDAKHGAMYKDLKVVASLMSATTLTGLGYKTTRVVSAPGGGDVRTESLGPYGNFGQQKYEWAEAFLKSDREQRLEFLNIDSDAWGMAENYIHAGRYAELTARQLHKEDDLFRNTVIYSIAGGFVVAGFIFPPAAKGAGLLAAAASSGAAASLTAVGVTLAATKDLQTSLKAGASSFLSAGVMEYASLFTGKGRVIADAFSRGVINKLSGKDFVDGVMSSVLQHYGAQLGASATAKLQDMAPQFVADLSGKMVESAIINKGDLNNFDEILGQYILDYANGRVSTTLTAAFGEVSGKQYATIFDGLGEAVVHGGANGLSNYLGSPAFLAALGEGVSVGVLEHFGGEESFTAQILSQLARASVISGGDPDRLASSVVTIGQGLLAEYAGANLRGNLENVPENQRERADSLAELLEVGITSGWDQSTMQGYAFGPLLQAMAGDSGAGQFLANGIGVLAASYEKHDGNVAAMTGDIAFYIGAKAANAAAANGPETETESVTEAANEPAETSKESVYVHPGDIDETSSPEAISLLQERLSELSVSLNSDDLDPGPVDGLWGERTEAGLRGFQEYQLQLLNTALDLLDHLPGSEYTRLFEHQRNQLLADVNQSRAGSVTGELLERPYDAISMNSLVGKILDGSAALPASATADDLAAFIEQSLNDPENGLITVGNNAGQLDGLFAQQIRLVITEITKHPELLQETVERLSSSTLQLWADGVNSLSPAEVNEFVDLIATSLNADQLNAFFAGMNNGAQDALVEAIFASGDTRLIDEFSNVMLREQLEQQPLTSEEISAYLDLAQMSLDMVGVVDPTGVADIAGAVLALSRGQMASAMLSVIGLIPWVGDLAKAGKLGGYAKYVDNAVDLAIKNPPFKDEVAPLLIRIEEQLHALKHSAVWTGLTTRSQDHLNTVLNKISTLKLDGSTLAVRVIPGVGRRFGDNELTWGFDELGRTNSVKGDIREIFSNKRTSSESSTTGIVGGSPDGDAHTVGGHIAAHRFTGEDTGLFNIVPQNGRRDPLSAADVSNLNQGSYAQFENEVSEWVKRGGRVEFDVELAYSGGSKAPDSFGISYSVFDKDGKLVFDADTQDLLNQSGQKFNRTSIDDINKALGLN